MRQEPGAEAGIGLRERKKALARARLEDAALGLFVERGYEATSVEEIAEAAMVSPSTFFRYYGSKDEVLFAPERAEIARLRDLLADRPEVESILDALRAVVGQLAVGYEAQQERILARSRLLARNPGLAASYLEILAGFERIIGAFAARRLGVEPTDRRARLIAAAAMAAYRVAEEAWCEGGGRDHLPTLVSENYALLVGGLSESLTTRDT